MASLSQRTCLSLAMLLCACLYGNAQADDQRQINAEMDWPCQQALVSDIPAAVVWAGPSIDKLQVNWQQDDDISRMVNRMSSPDYDESKAEGEIEQFSKAQPATEKDARLSLLFAGLHESLNQIRKKELDGIMRYSHGQALRADQLSQELDEMVRLQDDPSAAAQERLQMMQKEMEIKHRMFDEREAFIEHLCTRPVLIEEKLGVLARTIAYYLD